MIVADLMASLRNAKSPRIIGTHIPWNMLPEKIRNGEVKVSTQTRTLLNPVLEHNMGVSSFTDYFDYRFFIV